MKKAWIISELFYPDQVSTAHIMTAIAGQMALKNEVHVICGPAGYEKSYAVNDKRLPGNIFIHRISIPNLDKNKPINRIIRQLILTLKIVAKCFLKVNKGDSVLMVTNPALLVLLIGILKFVKKFRLSILVHDVFPENMVPAGFVKKESAKFKILKKLFDKAYSRADRLLVLGGDMRELMHQKIKSSSQPPAVDIVTNWGDDDVFSLSDFSIDDYYGISTGNRIVIGFAGNLGRVQGLLEFITLLNQDGIREHLFFIMVGDGALKPEIESVVTQRQLRHIYLAGSKPRSEQNHFINACDICLITLKAGMYGLGVPSKTYNILSAGKPILYIGDKGSEVDRYVNEFDCGWSFSWDEVDKIDAFLKSLPFLSKSALVAKGQNGLRASTAYFAKSIVLSNFDNL